MKVEQIYKLMNEIAEEVVGKEFVVEADLSNVVQLGEAILNKISYDNYVRTLVNHIGKVDFHNRIYAGGAPSIYKDAWEYGSIREKISFVLPEAEENPSWKLVDGNVYEQDQFKAPSINVKFYNDRTTYQIQLSITERQVKESFSSASQLNSFISGLHVAVENAITIRNDALIMETIDSMIAHTLNAGTSANKVDVLSLYNTRFSKSLTPAAAITDPDFIKFASYLIGLYSDRMTRVSTLFNLDGETRFTPKDKLHVVLLSEFAKAANSYLQSETFHDEFTALPQAETVPFWQGSGKDYGFDNTSKIDVTVKDITSNVANATINVAQSGIIGVMFDDWAVGVTNEDRRTTSHVNSVGEFTNYWYKVDAEYFNDLSENFVVFYLGTTAPVQKTIVLNTDELTNAHINVEGWQEDNNYLLFIQCSEGYHWTAETNKPMFTIGDDETEFYPHNVSVFTDGDNRSNCRVEIGWDQLHAGETTIYVIGTPEADT